MDPLPTDGVKIDNETQEVISRERIDQILSEFAEAIEFFADLESGLFTITLSDYYQIPAITLDLWRTFRSARREKLREMRERNKPKKR